MSEQQSQGAEQALDLNNEMQSRREKLAALRKEGIAFPNDFRRDATSDKLHSRFRTLDPRFAYARRPRTYRFTESRSDHEIWWSCNGGGIIPGRGAF